MRPYDRAMWLRRTRKGWAEPAPKRCANGHELRGGTGVDAQMDNRLAETPVGWLWARIPVDVRRAPE